MTGPERRSSDHGTGDDDRLAELVAGLHQEDGGRRPVGDDERAACDTLSAVDDVLVELGAATGRDWEVADSLDPLRGDRVCDHPAGSRARIERGPWGWLLAVAAALVVAGVFLVARSGPPLDAQVTGRGEDLEVRCRPLHSGHGPLHAALGFHLEIEARDGRPVWVGPRDPAAEAVADGQPGFATVVGVDDSWHVKIDVVIRDPEGRELSGFAMPELPESGLAGDPLELDLHLHQIWVRDGSPTPYVTVFPGEESAQRAQVDFVRGFARYGLTPQSGHHPFLPLVPGRHEVEITVRGRWGAGSEPIFGPDAAPTTLRHAFVVDGSATAWSEPVEGLRARLLSPEGAWSKDADWPLALQIENVGELARRYNALGATQAPIPQPLHLRLWVDGEEVAQREGLPVVVPARWFGEQLPGTILTLLLSPRSCWRVEEHGWQPGDHELSLELDFKPLLFANDPRLWMGRLRSPPARVRLR